MARWGCALVLLCICASRGSEVKELAGAGPMEGDAETSFAENAGENGPTSLFPGPTYGLPGYKESHDWVKAYDIFSPLVFDADWYALHYELTDKTHNEIKTDWAAHLADEANSYPTKCRQGNANFSPQKFYRANPTIKDNLEMNSEAEETCGSIVKVYLTQGVLDGMLKYKSKFENEAYKANPAQLASEIIALPIAKTAPDGRKQLGWAIGDNFDNLGEDAINSGEQYTLTFWFKPMGARAPECNLLHHGTKLAEKAPMISQVKGGTNTYKFVVAQSNNNEFACTPSQELEEKQWHFIVLKVETGKISVQYNGKEVCSEENTEGITSVLEERALYVSSPFQPPVDGYLQKLNYYPMHVMSDALLGYTMESQQTQLEDLK